MCPVDTQYGKYRKFHFHRKGQKVFQKKENQVHIIPNQIIFIIFWNMNDSVLKIGNKVSEIQFYSGSTSGG